MTDEPAAPAANKTKIELPDMIEAVLSESHYYRGWAARVSPGNAADLTRKADALDEAAHVLEGAFAAVEFIRERKDEFKKWRNKTRGGER